MGESTGAGMSWNKKAISGVLDQCAKDFAFLVPDNGRNEI
ncbi:hypothetical protein B5T_01274 [Alloalcanivorax dieselolei B5]|uniref:Uncharacterized protein n=1 Tax=Alcanivorax dieselolei (strain DSM 16502 / CGMCC 1.3690 / MCCC 1A00001 / B-5) TaxID=930169 RepID=K0CD07_ALCDB|nr:hypothetical protein B5T_01274 [Alloalcanivorax dieselolei B5]